MTFLSGANKSTVHKLRYQTSSNLAGSPLRVSAGIHRDLGRQKLLAKCISCVFPTIAIGVPADFIAAYQCIL